MPSSARKQHANLSIRGDLLDQARQRRINLSQLLEDSLDEILRAQDRQTWLAENQTAIRQANAFVERYGLWSDGLRSF